MKKGKITHCYNLKNFLRGDLPTPSPSALYSPGKKMNLKGGCGGMIEMHKIYPCSSISNIEALWIDYCKLYTLYSFSLV